MNVVRLLVAALLMTCAVAWALEAQSEAPVARPQEPTISFTWVTNLTPPQQFSLTVESSGRAALEIVDLDAKDKTPQGDPFSAKFILPEPERQRIFDLAKEARYFNGNFDYTKRRIASTGIKTFSYADAAMNYSTSYNWSEDKAIQQLGAMFMGVYWTEYYGRILDQQYHYEKLGLDSTLRAMIDTQKNGDLSELQLVQPLLQEIAEDPQVMNIARSRARQLLQKIPAAEAAAAPSK